MGGAFGPPTQNTICHVSILASTDAQNRFYMQNHVREVVRNYQHIFLNKMFSLVGRWVNPDSLQKLSTCTARTHTCARARRQGWRHSTCSRGEATSLGLVEDSAGRWQGPPSVHHTTLLPSLSGGRAVTLSDSSVGDLTAANICT